MVVPPNAAATESGKNRSGCGIRVATRVWVWTSTAPGSTSSPVASIDIVAAGRARTRQVRFDGDDPPAVDGDIGRRETSPTR